MTYRRPPHNWSPAERELVITRIFDAPRELVFRMWTDPRHAIRWWGPKHHPAVHLEMDVRPAAAGATACAPRETGQIYGTTACFARSYRPSASSSPSSWEEEGERGLETLVTVTFADERGKTRMTLRQAPFQSSSERDGHGEGWNSTFDRLAEHLSPQQV